MSTLEERWRAGLEAEASTIDVEFDIDAAGMDGEAAVARVMRRGRRRHRRNQAVAAVTCLGLVAGSAAAWNANRAGGRPTELRIAEETGDGSDGPTAITVAPAPMDGLRIDPSTLPAVELGPTPYDWTARTVPFGDSISARGFGGAAATSAGLVAVSTRAGVRSADRPDELAVYTSDDGVLWTGSPLDGSRWFGGVTRTGRGLVAVGTAAATAPIERDGDAYGVGDVVVSFSSDDGESWRDIVLPIDLRAARADARARGQGANPGVGAAHVVERDGVTTVAVTITGEVRGERTLLYRSIDDETFTPIGGEIDAMVLGLVALGDDVAVLAHGQGYGAGVEIVDPTGRLTTLPALPLDPGWGLTAGVLGGRLTVAGMRSGWPALARWDGSAWSSTVLANGIVGPGTNAGVNVAAVGEGGVAFALDVYADPTAGLSVSDAGYTLRSDGTQWGFAVAEDATGELVATFGSLEAAAMAAGGRVRAVTDAAGVASSPTTAVMASTTMVAPQAMAIHTVVAGDVAVVLAERFGVTLAELAAANPDVDLTRIVPGVTLVVPPASSRLSGTTTTMPPPYDGGAGGLVALEVLGVDGSVVATLDVVELRRLIDAAYAAADGVAPRHDVVVVHSVDGEAWSMIDVGARLGRNVVGITNLAASTSGLAVTVAIDEDDPDAPAPADDGAGPFKRRVALVGTRR